MREASLPAVIDPGLRQMRVSAAEAFLRIINARAHGAKSVQMRKWGRTLFGIVMALSVGGCTLKPIPRSATGTADTWELTALATLDTIGPEVATVDSSQQVTIHVLLQVHPSVETGGYSIEDDVQLCQERLLHTILAIASHGARGVVLEGFEGKWNGLGVPTSIRRSIYEWHEGDAPHLYVGKRIAAYEGIDRYGFELPGHNAAINRAPRAVRRERERLPSNPSRSDTKRMTGQWNASIQLAYWALIGDEMEVTARSLMALRVAIDVARRSTPREAQIVIGASHWPDFEFAVRRLRDAVKGHDVAINPLRLVRYECPEAQKALGP